MARAARNSTQFTAAAWLFFILFVVMTIVAGWLWYKDAHANQDLKSQNAELHKQINQLKNSAQKATQPVQSGN